MMMKVIVTLHKYGYPKDPLHAETYVSLKETVSLQRLQV